MEGDWQTDLLGTARRRQTQWWLIGGGVAIVVLALGMGAGYVLAANQDDGDAQAAGWLVALIVAFPVVALIGMFALFFAGRRRGWTWLQPAPVAGTDRARRKRIVRAIRRNE